METDDCSIALQGRMSVLRKCEEDARDEIALLMDDDDSDDDD